MLSLAPVGSLFAAPLPSALRRRKLQGEARDKTYHIVENVTGPLLALGAGWSTQVLAHTVHLWESNQKDAGGSLVQFSTKVTTLVMTCAAVALVQIKRWLLA